MTPPPLLLRVRPAPRGALRRMTIVVSAKETPRAVERNRIRRRLWAALVEAGVRPSRAAVLVGTTHVKNVAFKTLVLGVRNALASFDKDHGSR